MAEYIQTFTIAVLITLLFLGGWHIPFISLEENIVLGFFVTIIKSYAVILIIFWFRGTFPRMRIDQLMSFAWIVLIPLSFANVIMKLSRLGSFHQSKLSFLRSFLREFKDWEYKRDLFNLDQNGYGEAVYSFKKKHRIYSLVCFGNEIKDDERSDRVIATKWDAAFTLHDGVPSKNDIERLKNEVPKQEVGRLSFKELTLSRANKSVRVFNHVVEALSNGEQPDLDLLSKVGYLYRTTAVYGSGKFGLADRFRIKNREEINGPFRLEMMLVYLVRQFTFDQVNHVAHHKNPKKAVKLDEKICKNLGIGNSTGLGMAPFIVNHPTLLNNWILSRETAVSYTHLTLPTTPYV